MAARLPRVHEAPRAGQPPARHTIAVLQVHPDHSGARRLGCDIDALLRRAAISPALLQSPSARVTQGQFAALMRSMRRVMRDEFWGLLSRPVAPGVFAQACRALIHCATLEDALHAGLHQYRLHLDDFVPRLQQRSERRHPAAAAARARHALPALRGIHFCLPGVRRGQLAGGAAHPARRRGHGRRRPRARLADRPA
ncbi:AraC family transcriptional regulator ligand-binding domain-containing protein [Cupriavidus basilensis]